ncbi:TfuA-like protein [Sinorhizobium garamanticum]|uniref:TfuA-like protein n=1 Tax=Sinorhizobium garamanticum TaxID=680247 RepID=A0ABY8DP26_9HYPH|nr:TfuA-like protein [Sinorhizobium garamanticum]WEX91330.1 TfuA-like protein [Sinorhizobium garamanticum]
MPPVVFLGPSAPASDISSILPDAIIRPPARRGDLYAYRILKHEFFLILDGAFGNVLAISPREVVDVVQDGAVVVGASSMGALRAADCLPAGAHGVGIIFRLFKHQAISAEDEVAVLYREEMPFPPLTEPLINMRIALRRATRKGLVGASEAEEIISAAQSLHYTMRTWPGAYQKAGRHLPSEMLDLLKAIDTKRADAILAAKRVSKMREASKAPLRRSNSSQLFGLLGNGRERPADALSGPGRQQIGPEFIEWLCCSGKAYRWLHSEITRLNGELVAPISSVWNILDGSGELETELMRFNVFKRAISEARRCGLRPSIEDHRQAERQLVNAHGVDSWNELLISIGNDSSYSERLSIHRTQLALTKCLRRTFLFGPGQSTKPREVLLWHPK